MYFAKAPTITAARKLLFFSRLAKSQKKSDCKEVSIKVLVCAVFSVCQLNSLDLARQKKSIRPIFDQKVAKKETKTAPPSIVFKSWPDKQIRSAINFYKRWKEISKDRIVSVCPSIFLKLTEREKSLDQRFSFSVCPAISFKSWLENIARIAKLP